MSFKSPDDYEKQAKDICDFLGITKITETKFHRLIMRLNHIEGKGADAAYSRFGRVVVQTLGNLENILAQIKQLKQ